MVFKTRILLSEFETYDVRRFIVEKPENFVFVPGQATDISINTEELKNEKRPFTFTSLNEDFVLEFNIKRYADREGITDKLHRLKSGDEILISEPFGTISYNGEGVFIAGGAGITPFIAILRNLKKQNKIGNNKLIFSNKTKKDIMLEKEFREMFSKENVIFTLTEEKERGYFNQRINKKFLQAQIENFSQNFYVCGPKEFVRDISEILKELGAEVSKIVLEK